MKFNWPQKNVSLRYISDVFTKVSEYAAYIDSSNSNSSSSRHLLAKPGGWPTHQINPYFGCPIHAVSSHEWAFAHGANRLSLVSGSNLESPRNSPHRYFSNIRTRIFPNNLSN